MVVTTGDVIVLHRACLCVGLELCVVIMREHLEMSASPSIGWEGQPREWKDMRVHTLMKASLENSLVLIQWRE